ncbi:uncharacterized protein LOC110395075 isoform X2 [Numida meleagris]|uniref:uncharacterized protein LOC110395075 isoform X2 n=1 Tax=Numida meleagris TaxID=8996 RepID=UPI000B3DA1FF|nr:uncharacterized protein LOC110395075 isoform X2 [Numida meleagris]
MARGNERFESKRCSRTEQITHKRRNEDLLTFYLRHQDAQRSPCACHQSNIFTLPCSDSVRRDIQVLQKFIRKYEPHGAVVTKEEVVIVSEDTDVCKQTSPKNLTKAANLMEEHRIEAGSRGCPESQSTDLGGPPGDTPRSQPPAPRAEPKDLGFPPDDFSKKVYGLAATCLTVTVGFLGWSRLRHQLGNYYWLSFTFVMCIALILLGSAASQVGSVNAFYTLTVAAIGSTILGIISDSYELVTVMLVGVITTAATLLLFLFALKTNMCRLIAAKTALLCLVSSETPDEPDRINHYEHPVCCWGYCLCHYKFIQVPGSVCSVWNSNLCY